MKIPFVAEKIVVGCVAKEKLQCEGSLSVHPLAQASMLITTFVLRE